MHHYLEEAEGAITTAADTMSGMPDLHRWPSARPIPATLGTRLPAASEG